MATPGDILIVRGNTNLIDSDNPTDEQISALIDDLGVTGTSYQIWLDKVAKFSEEVDVTEAGASHKFSDLFTHAKEMALLWQKLLNEELLLTTGRVKVKVINRQ